MIISNSQALEVRIILTEMKICSELQFFEFI
jgi:hypothetical protein